MPQIDDYDGALKVESAVMEDRHLPESYSERLHDRDDGMQQLLFAYQRCLRRESEDGIVLITGPSGVGKTSLALQLQKHVDRDNGYLLTGKFDQLSSCSPCPTDAYTPFVEAITKYTDLIIQQGQGAAKCIRMALLETLDLTELRVLRGTIPALGKIIGDSTTAPCRKILLQGADAERRFAHIYCKLVRTISSQGYPIVLLLDDLQWAYARGSIVLLQALAKIGMESTRCRFLLLGTRRTDEDLESQQFGQSDAGLELQFDEVSITKIELTNLSEAAVSSIVSEATKIPLDAATRLQLVTAIYDRTGGNAFYVSQLVQEIVESNYNWQSVVGSCSTDDAESVVNHLSRKIQKLPDDVKAILKVAGCIGTAFSEDCLFEGSGLSLSAFCTAVRTIEEKGIISFEQTLRTGCFRHDRFQQVSYELIPVDERDGFHLMIGRRLRVLLRGSSKNHHLLTAANQIRRGIHLIYNVEERNDLSRFFFRAGEAAASASSFAAAAQYLQCGIKLLDKHHWTKQYDLSLALHNTAAEIEYYNGNLFRLDALVARIIIHAKCFNDTLVARFTQIYSLGTRGEMDRAIDDGMSLLRQLGEPFPHRANIVRIGIELLRCKRLLLGKSASEILSLPQMKTKKHLTSMRLMNIIYGFAYFTRKELMPLIASRLVQITLKHGLCEMSSIGFASLGLVYSTLGFIDEAYQFTQLGILISEKYPSDEWQGHISANIYAFAYPLKHPIRDSLGPLLAGHRAGLVAGDIHVSLVCASINCMFTMHAGYPLPFVLNDINTYRRLCVQYGQNSVQIYYDIMGQFCLNMMGKSENPLVFSGEAMNEDKVLIEIKERKNLFAIAALVNSKHAVAVYMNDLNAANVMAARLKSVKSKLLPLALNIHHFLQGIVSATLSRTSRYHRRQAHLILTKLRKCSHHCSENFLNKVYLVEAELASSMGNVEKALMKYEMSIQLARDQQCVREEALACERAGYSLREWGQHEGSLIFFARAQLLYSQWGAQIKVDQLKDLLAS